MKRPVTYRSSGVDIDAGARLVDLIKPGVRGTFRKEVVSDLGGFGALFSARFKGLKDPVLVSSTDGVGTKLKIAQLVGDHSTVGIDLVAMSVNDVLVSGAEPLFFLDYFATGALKVKTAASVINGIAAGCKEAGCALIGGETAEMPGFYAPGEYDLAGFCVGVVDKSMIIDGAKIRPGDAIIGIASSGLHSNGFSLARKVLFDRMKLKPTSRPRALGKSVGEALIAPTRIYVKPILELIRKEPVLGLVHITGGGFTENIPRILPKNTKAVIELGAWPVNPIFKLIMEGGPVEADEMLRVFNCGIGMVLITPEARVGRVISRLKSRSLDAWAIGRVERHRAAKPVVEYSGERLY